MTKITHEIKLRNRIKLLGGKFKFNYLGQFDGRKQSTAVIKIANKYYMGFAECSKKDEFNRKIGRAIALGRAWKRYEAKNSHDIESMKKSSPLALFKEDRPDGPTSITK